MKKILSVMGLLLLVLVSIGCSKDAVGVKELGRAVVSALKAKEIDTYLDLCVTIDDKKFLITSSDLTLKEKKAQRAFISTSRRDIYESKYIRTANFNDIASLSGWENAVVQKIILKKRINENGIIYYEEIIVRFKQSVIPDLKISKVVKVKDKWKIMDDKALGFMSMI